ncbi:MAG: hypothetical protein U0871_20305 [Gemmataceae bacterium]
MFPPPDRRSFLASSAVTLAGLRPVSAAEAALDPAVVRLDAGIEPFVRLLEETPRDRVVEEVADRIKKGAGYRDVLAALFLAGVRNVPPRPTVGFKFHAVLVVNSAHLAALAGPDTERWLPILWAVDNFKGSQATAQKEGGWRMKPADEGKVPTARKAKAAFAAAMDNWDEGAADVAAAGLARSFGANELFDLFARYGCRDFRDIGHKAIYVANAFRTLQTIGWHHAEPVLRSLAYALLQHEGDNPAKRDAPADRPGRLNAERVTLTRKDWLDGQPSPEDATDLLARLRTGTDAEVADRVVELLCHEVAPQTVWDALFLAAGELLMRQPGIVALHSITTLNALRYAYDTVADDSLRRLLLLQAASFVPLFRDAMTARGKVGDACIDRLGVEVPNDPVPVKFEDIFPTLSADKLKAARMAADYLRQNPAGATQMMDTGRRLVFRKGTDSHDYKFSSAVLEDYRHLSPGVRDRFLAASLCWLKGSAGPDAPIVKRVRTAVG